MNRLAPQYSLAHGEHPVSTRDYISKATGHVRNSSFVIDREPIKFDRDEH